MATAASLDLIVASLATVDDESLAGSAHTPRGRLVFETITALPRPRHGRTRVARRRLPAVAAFALAVAATAAIVLVTSRGGGSDASAATVLHRAAVAARADKALTPGPGQFLYTKSVDAWETDVLDAGASYRYLQPHLREIWISADGSGRLYETSGTARFLSEADQAKWVAAGRPSLVTPPADQELSPSKPQDLSTDADTLYAQLHLTATRQGNGVASEMFVLVGDALRETATTPAQRAALYEVAARIPGVTLVGRVTDPVGRAGIAVSFTANNSEHRLVFDSKSYALLAEVDVALAGNPMGYAPGTQTGYAAYLTQGIVDSKTARP